MFGRYIVLRLNKLSCRHVCIPTCVGNLVVVPVTIGHSNMCWHFVFKFGWLAIGQKFLPPSSTQIFPCEFLLNSPLMGLAFGHSTQPWQCFAHLLFYHLCLVAYNFDGTLPGDYAILAWDGNATYADYMCFFNL